MFSDSCLQKEAPLSWSLLIRDRVAGDEFGDMSWGSLRQGHADSGKELDS